MRQIYFFLLSAAMMIPDVVNAQAATRELTNLVVFVRFADDEEIDHSFNAIDSMFNSREPGYYSVYNYYDAMSYGRIHYNTVYTSNVQNGVIVSYVDPNPRGAFQPWSESNPIGYQCEIPFMGVAMIEAQLLGRILDYVDSMHLVPDTVNLDGDGDGDIDNISFIVKGGVGDWASLLWPHMEYFPHDSLDHTVTVNGVRPNAFNFEFEGAGRSYFDVRVFCHEMGHSLGLPDLYHYVNYDYVMPAGAWDIMHGNWYGPNHTAAIYKNNSEFLRRTRIIANHGNIPNLTIFLINVISIISYIRKNLINNYTYLVRRTINIVTFQIFSYKFNGTRYTLNAGR